MTSPPAAGAGPRNQPRSVADLFFSFTFLALQGFGGVLAVVQREIVENKRWMTREEFIEEWAVAQIMPGPNVINFSLMIGGRYFGLRGAAAAVGGMLCAPLVVVLTLAILYSHFSSNPQLAAALRGMGAVTAGLVMATGLKLVPALRNHPLGVPACAAFSVATYVGLAVLHWPLAWVLLGLGGVACGLTYRKLGSAAP